ncbi:hypothetical protein LX32DRAFT_656759 [Colletotrichum zoysiae]|uniref:Uncharacterized protein n=1 Tax=Colletotrichum zoysiae TaxID=1216348 RepID=A0AAD9LWW3_9PEZI|nr:hypothetical protein LX32DRAFT_656759 [Colletotrichum zoysiae]
MASADDNDTVSATVRQASQLVVRDTPQQQRQEDEARRRPLFQALFGVRFGPEEPETQPVELRFYPTWVPIRPDAFCSISDGDKMTEDLTSITQSWSLREEKEPAEANITTSLGAPIEFTGGAATPKEANIPSTLGGLVLGPGLDLDLDRTCHRRPIIRNALPAWLPLYRAPQGTWPKLDYVAPLKIVTDNYLAAVLLLSTPNESLAQGGPGWLPNRVVNQLAREIGATCVAAFAMELNNIYNNNYNNDSVTACKDAASKVNKTWKDIHDSEVSPYAVLLENLAAAKDLKQKVVLLCGRQESSNRLYGLCSRIY